MNQILSYLLDGITYGSIYAIVAIGFNIIYNTTGIINFAQGEFVMLGAMIASTFHRPGSIDGVHLPMIGAVAAAVVIVALVGVLVELIFIRWLKKPSVLRMIIITIGVSILIRELALHIWDEKPRFLQPFTGISTSSISILGARVSPQVLWVLGTTLVVVVALSIFFRMSNLGREMRACAANRTGALLCGINTRRLVTLSFMLSAALGALAGCVLCPISGTQYDIGTSLAIKGFTVAILGGLGNSGGAVAAGMMLGILEAFSVSLVGGGYKEVTALALLLIVLCLRPSGIFGRQEADRLKEF